MADDSPLISAAFPLTGRLITSQDSTVISSNEEINFKSLKNMRYTETTPKSISGMTKINTTALSSYPKIRNGYHFRKENPSESYFIVQAYNSGLTESKLYMNTTAIPSQGDFSGTVLWTDSSGADKGIFSDAVNGNFAYCNSVESLIWGGSEHFCSGFVVNDNDGDMFYEFTDQIQNSSTDELATLTKVTSDLPSGTGLLLHLDNNVTDSSTTGHTVTNNNVTFSTTSKFGTHSAVFNGTNAYLTIPDHSNFDFSGGNFSIDFWFKPDSGNGTIYSQATDSNNYFKIVYSLNEGLYWIIRDSGTFYGASVPVGYINLALSGTGEFHHCEVTEDGDNWYVYIDGNLSFVAEETTRLQNYTGLVHIGVMYDGSSLSQYFDGSIDEFRIGKATYHTNYFEPRNVPYGTAAAYVNIGAVRPIQGAKFYVDTANTTSGSAKIEVWKQFEIVSGGSGTPNVIQKWSDVSNETDNTSSGGKTLAQTGTITFDDTDGSAHTRLINGAQLFWYRFTFVDVDDTTTIYHVKLDMAIQKIKNLWDGENRSALSFEITNATGVLQDNTINVFEPTYNSANTATYVDLDGLVAGHIIAGFAERLSGIEIKMVTGNSNTTISNLTVFSWRGDEYKRLRLTEDGTFESGAPLGKSGVIKWTPSQDDEVKRTVSGRPALYYYKLQWDETLSANVKIYYVGGIPNDYTLPAYKFSIVSHNRLILCSESDGNKNSVLIGANATNSVFNGYDSIKLNLGNDDEFVAGAGLYSQFSSSLYNLTVLCKKTETWLIEGNSPENYTFYKASGAIGCVAPHTMRTCNVDPTESGSGYHAAIWQGINGIYLCNGRDINPIHHDIKDIFDRINTSKLSDSFSFVDEVNDEYHWLVATGASTNFNEEWVFDIRRGKWYQIDRTLDLQAGFNVIDTNGNGYTYGATDTGYVERLENGTTFDGNDIVSQIQTSDVMIDSNPMTETQLRHIKLIAKAKTNTSNTVSVTHYGDTNTSGSSFPSFSVNNANGRIVKATKSVNHQGGHIFHSIKLSLTTNDESSGLEPLYLGAYYKTIRRSLN